MKQDRRLTINAELRAQQPQAETPDTPPTDEQQPDNQQQPTIKTNKVRRFQVMRLYGTPQARI